MGKESLIMLAVLFSASTLAVQEDYPNLMSFSAPVDATIFKSDYFSIPYKYNIEAKYGTRYSAASGIVDYDTNTMSYGVGFKMSISAGIDFRLFKSMKYGISVTYAGFDVMPYQQVISWTAPSAVVTTNVDNFDLTTSGQYKLFLGSITTFHKFEAPAFEVSIASWFYDLLNGYSSFKEILPQEIDWSPTLNMVRDPNLSTTLGLILDPTLAWSGTQVMWEWNLK